MTLEQTDTGRIVTINHKSPLKKVEEVEVLLCKQNEEQDYCYYNLLHFNIMMLGDEDVIRRRLLIDGDGTGDDRRLNVLLKTLIKWCNSSDEQPEESKATHDRMLAQLAQCEFAVTKSQLGSETMSAELKSYEALSKILETGIEVAKGNIDKSKADLAQAKTVRKNRTEYDVLAKVISEQPDRKETLEQLSTLKTELSSLEGTKQQLESRLGLRKKQFHVLVTSIHQLQALLDEPDEVETITDDVDMEDIVLES